jgi:outer membrane lipopolysaccharide assembly protein LptE/RlpB
MRSYLKNNGTIDKVLGKPSEELYGKDTEADMDTDEMAKATCEQIVNTVLEVEKNKETGENNEKRLADFGIRVSSIKIVDISPEITDERELQALRSAVIRRANARGIALEGKGEASAQKSILDVHKDNDKEISSAIINGRALEGASTGGSTIDALVSSFTQNKQRDNQAKK